MPEISPAINRSRGQLGLGFKLKESPIQSAIFPPGIAALRWTGTLTDTVLKLQYSEPVKVRPQAQLLGPDQWEAGVNITLTKLISYNMSFISTCLESSFVWQGNYSNHFAV
jgi:hypothetical protein